MLVGECQDKLAHMLSDITGMQLMCTRMSQLQARGRVSIEHAAIAKLNTGDGARRVCAMARDILGGNGILLDHHVARHHADIEAVYTYEGTDSIQSLDARSPGSTPSDEHHKAESHLG